MSDEKSATTNEHAHRVREMFAAIAGRYDLLNHLLSGNIDKRWRRLVARELSATLANSHARVLDVACGTGDLSLTLFENGTAKIIGLDFCRPMLDVAASKSMKLGCPLSYVEGDALNLPFPAGIFDAVTIAFGLRNLASTEVGFRELLRILKPGGTVAVLEFSKPKIPLLRSFFRFYFTKLLPVIGGWLSGSQSAYRYLPDSVIRFPNQEELASQMEEAGFERVSFQNLTGGIAALHQGNRPV